jgi:hypothetical protein
MARAVVGRPASQRVIPSRKKKAAKHKKRELEKEFD